MVMANGLNWAFKELMQEAYPTQIEPSSEDRETSRKSPLELLVRDGCLPVAAAAGDLSVVQTLLEVSNGLNKGDSLFGYPLYAAACAGQVSCVQTLLEASADAARSQGHLGSPIEAAAYLGRLEVVQTLAYNGVNLGASLADALGNDRMEVVVFLLSLDRVDINASRNRDSRPIFVALTKGYGHTAALLARRPELFQNWTDSRGRTPLHMAAMEGEVRVAAVLLSRQDVDPNVFDTDADTPLHIACMNGYGSIVGALLARNDVDVNMEDIHGRTPLSRALVRGHRCCVALLLQHPNLDASIGMQSRTPLVLAAMVNDIMAMELLLERPEVRAYLSFTESLRESFFWAAVHGHARMTRLILDREPVDVNNTNLEGWHPLHYAIRVWAHSTELILSIDGMDVNFICYHQTPLLCAVLSRNLAAVELLFSRSNIDINIASVHGTSLSCSLFMPDNVPEAADLLLKRADLNPNVTGRRQITEVFRVTKEAKNEPDIGSYLSYVLLRESHVREIGKPPLVRAASRGKVAVMLSLLRLDAINPNAVDSDGRTALWWATTVSHDFRKEKVRLLLRHPATDPNVSDRHGWSPLFMAIFKRSFVLVDMLLEDRRTNPNLANEDGYTPLHLAVITRQNHIVKRLRRHPGVV